MVSTWGTQVSDRIAQLEALREEFYREFESEYGEVAISLGLSREATLEACADKAFDRLKARTFFRSDRSNGAGAGERLGRPRAILGRGGDCDDLVSLHGGIVRWLRPEDQARLASVYVPSGNRPRHVYLQAGQRVYDLTPTPSCGASHHFPSGYHVGWCCGSDF